MNQSYILLIVFMFQMASCAINGQENNYTTPRNAGKKTIERYQKAYNYTIKNDYDSAIKAFEKLIKKDPFFVNSYIQLGYIYESQDNYDKAVFYFKKSINIAPDYNPQIYMALGRIAMNQGNYTEVEKYLTKLLTFDKLHSNLVRIAKKRLGDARFRPWAKNNPVIFEPVNLGENINSKYREYFPSITLEDELVYTVLFGKGNDAQEDLYISKKEGEVWSPGSGIQNVNTIDNEGAQCISADGKLLVFTVCNRREDYGSCDLYFSRKINNKWTTPKNIGSPVNSKDWESQPSITANGNAIFFVRGGAKGQGNKDLYITRLKHDNTWTVPEPITELNTLDNESSPCIHPDGKTLYFSSDGYPGMGGFDLFVSRKDEGKWGEPRNLGYPINTIDQEEALAVNRKGFIAYLASDREGGFGSLDIYGFKLPDYARPDPVTYVKGVTIDASNNMPLSAQVEIVNLKTNKTLANVKTKADGAFTICMPLGEYALNATKNGYLFFSANYNLTEVKSLDKAYKLEARLHPIEFQTDEDRIKEPIVLENIFFASASAILEKESLIELANLKALLDKHPELHIRINGHTDNVGKPETNLNLSIDRANAVVQYLIDEGISKDRLSSMGFGETKPRYQNDTKIGRAGNRRTEFEVLNQ
ncbi:MAG: OmpA family protein [Saprospiraceae bacterium]|nr:OmpA family protein [Saprospiraceae bacterium]